MHDERRKKSTSFKLTPEGVSLLKRLSLRLGLSQAGVVELALRKLAQAEQAQEVGSSPPTPERPRDYTVHGMRIRARRLRKGWTQEVLAKKAGLQTGTVSRVETGYHQPQLASIASIAQSLDCSADDLVTWHIDLSWEAS